MCSYDEGVRLLWDRSADRYTALFGDGYGWSTVARGGSVEEALGRLARRLAADPPAALVQRGISNPEAIGVWVGCNADLPMLDGEDLVVR